jgi:hypothetical protein
MTRRPAQAPGEKPGLALGDPKRMSNRATVDVIAHALPKSPIKATWLVIVTFASLNGGPRRYV